MRSADKRRGGFLVGIMLSLFSGGVVRVVVIWDYWFTLVLE